MLEGDAEPIAAGVTLPAEGVRVLSDGVPVGEDKDRRDSEVVESVAHCGFFGRGEDELSPFI